MEKDLAMKNRTRLLAGLLSLLLLFTGMPTAALAGETFVPTKKAKDGALVGDVNKDNAVDATDRMLLARYLAGWEGYEERILSMDAADIDRNGLVEAKDRMLLARFLAGWEGYEEYFCGKEEENMLTINVLTSDVKERVENRAAALKETIYSSGDVVPDGECYYLSADGNDLNDGLTPETAWKTLAVLENHSFAPGTCVLFRRGDMWRGRIVAQPGVTYAAYGAGEKPRLYGSPFDGAKTGQWEEVLPDIWRFSEKLTDDCGGIVFNGGEKWAVKCVVNYEGDTPVDNVTREPFTGYQDLRGDLAFWHELPPEAVHDDAGGYIYLRSESGNPAERFDEIEFLPRYHGISVYYNDITVDNLCIMYYGAHGISAGTVERLHVKNSVFAWIGGSLQFVQDGRPVRFGNGVEVYGGCKDYVVENCHVYQCYDAGITFQCSAGEEEILMDGVAFRDNLIENCSYSIEYFLGKGTNQADRQMRDILISGCVMRQAGAGWGVQRPDKHEEAHIKSWDHYNRLTGAFLIENNLFDRAEYMMLHVAAEEEDWLPVFRDNEYIQYENGLWGRIGKSITTMQKYSADSISEKRFGAELFYSAEKPEPVTIGSGSCGENLEWKIYSDGVLEITGTGRMKDYSIDGSDGEKQPWSDWKGSVTELRLSGSMTHIGKNAFRDFTFYLSANALVIPESVETIGAYAFSSVYYDCDLVIPDSVTIIDEYAFQYSDFNGRKLILGNGLKEVKKYAFNTTNFSGDLTIPDSVMHLGQESFSNGQWTGTLTLGKSLEEIGGAAFAWNAWLTGTLTIPTGVTYIDWYAFAGCGFTGIPEFPSGLKGIGGYAFLNCTGFEGTLMIPAEVKSIEEQAFHGCVGITGARILGNAPVEMGANVFDGCAEGFTIT